MNAIELRRRFDAMMANMTDDELVAEFESVCYPAEKQQAPASPPEAIVTHFKKCDIHSLSVFSHLDMLYQPEEWHPYDQRCLILNKEITTKDLVRLKSLRASREVDFIATESNDLALAA